MERLLLHACCAPCSVAVIDEALSAWDLAVVFYNPNIHPEAEYLKRKAEVVRFCRNRNVPMIDLDSDPERWEREVGGIPQEREGGPRCSACFRLRLRRVAECAKGLGFGTVATSLTSGRNKRREVIAAIGRLAAEPLGLAFLDEDWKKGGRQERAREIVREMGIYRQDYCGCRHSLADRRQRNDLT